MLPCTSRPGECIGPMGHGYVCMSCDVVMCVCMSCDVVICVCMSCDVVMCACHVTWLCVHVM